MSALTRSQTWKDLEAHQREMAAIHMRDLFAQDPERFDKFSLQLQRHPPRLLQEPHHRARRCSSCVDLAEAGRPARAGPRQMFTGEKINVTEDRAVLHVALRNRSNRPILVDGKDVMPEVNARARADARVQRRGAQRRLDRATPASAITDVVNIGIGGSDLGPVMVTEALQALRASRGLRVALRLQRRRHAHRRDAQAARPRDDALHRRLEDLHHAGDADQRAHRARVVPASAAKDEAHVAKHFVALSTNAGRGDASSASTRATCSSSGTGSAGATRSGRRSACRSRCIIGMDNFEELLAGAPRDGRALPHRAAREEPAGDPRRCSASGTTTSSAPRRTPSCPTTSTCTASPPTSSRATWRATARASTRDGEPVDYSAPGPIIWGEPGTNGQHAFYQLIHQGTKLDPVRLHRADRDAQPDRRPPRASCSSNFFAQTEALMQRQDARTRRAPSSRRQGMTRRERSSALAAAQGLRGQPADELASSFEKLTPRTLGSLIAMYEHKIFVQGIDLEHQLLRPVGRGARQAAGEGDPAGARRRRAR